MVPCIAEFVEIIFHSTNSLFSRRCISLVAARLNHALHGSNPHARGITDGPVP